MNPRSHPERIHPKLMYPSSHVEPPLVAGKLLVIIARTAKAYPKHESTITNCFRLIDRCGFIAGFTTAYSSPVNGLPNKKPASQYHWSKWPVSSNPSTRLMTPGTMLIIAIACIWKREPIRNIRGVRSDPIKINQFRPIQLSPLSGSSISPKDRETCWGVCNAWSGGVIISAVCGWERDSLSSSIWENCWVWLTALVG